MKIHVGFGGDWNQMDVGMGDLKAYHRHADALAGHSFFKAGCHALGKKVHCLEICIVDIEDVAVFFFGDDEGVARSDGIDVKEGKKLVVLGNFVAGNFACNDSRKYCSHNQKEISTISNFIIPAGTLISTISPIL